MSKNVRQVLDSEMFKAWVPEDRFRLELTVIGNSVIGLILSATIGAIFARATTHDGNYGLFFLKFLGLALLAFLVYCAFSA